MGNTRRRTRRYWRQVAVVGLAILAAPVGLGSPGCPTDYDDNGQIEPADISLFVTTWYNSLNQGTLAGDWDHNGVVQPADISLFVSQWFAQLNAGGCPPAITLTVSPTSGTLGTPINLTISPATAPNVFDNSTTASWTGRYVPMVGTPTSVFTVTFSAADVRENSASQAVILLGAGSASLPSGIENLGPGVFDGTLTVNLSGGAAPSRSLQITPETNAARFEVVDYPGGPGGALPPALAGEPSTLQILLLSLRFDPAHPNPATLQGSTDCHLAATLRLVENAATLVSAPATVHVDLVSFNAAGSEYDRLHGLTLFRNDSDGDPAHITYINDLSRPILLIDTAVDRGQYPNFYLLFAPIAGSAAIVPST